MKKLLSTKWTYEELVRFFYRPTDPSSLGIIRLLFGLLMLADLPGERGGSDIDIRWGDTRDCHFPLFNFLQPLKFPYMCLLYAAMTTGALGIMLGFKFKISTLLFGIPYWYILLLDKSFWNNHSYLYGIITILLMGSSANHFCSVDGLLDKTIRNTDVPYWNYFILKFQFFLLYFLAGLKKADHEWLSGYSMTDIGHHWVFAPFQIIFTPEQIDYFVVHWFGFLLDLTIGFWMLVELTRPLALLFCSCFHLMNSRLFSIGMFPYVCLATLPLFCTENWPRKLFATTIDPTSKPSTVCIYDDVPSRNCDKLPKKVKWKHKLVVLLLLSHCCLQVFLPYSHFITKGYNNWTNGLYGYSWDMMIHSWNTILVVVKIVDNNTGKESFIDAEAWTQNDRWNKHADMILQYAECIKNNLAETPDGPIATQNLSIYVDVWCSLNNRFQQRMYNPNYDLLKANWSPFQPVEWLLPVLTEYNDFRIKINQITEQVYTWSNYSDVLFIADFPGLYLENYISDDLQNVTLTVLEGKVVYEVEDDVKQASMGVKLFKGDSFPVETGVFHRIHTVGDVPSCYMYTYVKNASHVEKNTGKRQLRLGYSPFPLIEDVQQRLEAFSKMLTHILNAFYSIICNQALNVRKNIE